MFAVQLLRFLETVPPNMSDDTCIGVDSVKLEPDMNEIQNWATFDDNGKDEFWKRSEFKRDKSLHTDGKINDDGFENENGFVASPLVSFDKCVSLKERDLYTDKNVTEFELPELMVCYRENDVKDICVDDGVSSMEKISVDGEICEVKTEMGTGECESTQEVEVESLSSKESIPLSKNNYDGIVGYDNEINNSASGKITDVVSGEKLVADYIPSLGKSNELKSLKALFDSRSSDASDIEHLSDQITHPKTSESPTVGQPDDDSNKGNSELSFNSKTESGTITFDFNSGKLEYESIDESLNNKNNNPEQSVEVNSLPIHDNTKSNSLSNENKVQRVQGESSFSMVGHVPGLITYSGSIPYSGSISIRSESSTTSTRSFAFPILPNEWNSSPVRMAKADRRRFRSNKGWINGLFCCKF